MNYEFCEGMTHTIKKGDTLYSISRQHNVPIAMIMRANPYVDVYNLQVGETICIPVENTVRAGRGANIVPLTENNPANMQTDMENEIPWNTQMPTNTNTSQQSDADMQMRTVASQPAIQQSVMDNDNVEEMEDNGDWVRYITQAGDTLQDIMDKSDGDEKSFWAKNTADRMYMLPGIAYYIYETGD